MKLTIENIMEYVTNVMDARQIADFNAWRGTAYTDRDELIESESAETLLEFYS